MAPFVSGPTACAIGASSKQTTAKGMRSAGVVFLTELMISSDL
jgi:hypothetical protein